MVTSVTSTRAADGRLDSTGRRSVRVGHSWADRADLAGAEAARDALRLADPRLLIVFASIDYDLPRLVAGVRAVSGEVPVIGCCTAGELGPGPVVDRGVVVVGLGGDFTVRTTIASGLREHPREVGEAVARGLLPLPETRYRVALLLTDSLIGDQQEMVRGAYGVLGATVPLVGGGGGDNVRPAACYQFHNGDIRQESVVAAVIGSDAPIGCAVRHGLRRRGEPMVVTGASGNDVHTFDDRAALDVYLDRHAAPAGIENDPAAFLDFAFNRPLAVARRGDVAIRHVLAADPARRTLTCAAAVSRGTAAWLAEGDADSALAAAEAAAAEAIGQLGAATPLGLLVFDCVARRSILGESGQLNERRLLSVRSGDTPLAGFYSCGEIARTKGVLGYHNQTIVAVALG